MPRYLPARYQIIRQIDLVGGSKLGVLGHLVEFPNGKCVVAEVGTRGRVDVFDSLDEAKSTHVTDGAELERID